jgi:hypothetical protein
LKFEQCKNPIVEKECKNILEKQLKSLGKDICVVGDNKKIKIVNSFKNYLKYFGHQNTEIMNKVKNNEKLKEIFLSEEKSIYRNIIFEEKDSIIEIDNEFTRCSIEGLHNY